MADVLRVTIKGGMPNGEEWSINPVYSIGGDFGAPVSASQASTIAAAIAAVVVPTGLMNQMGNTTTVTGARVEARSLAGVLESQGEAVKTTPQAGQGLSASHPFQTSLVISLRTGTPGASGRGRLYWPATGAQISASTLRFDSTQHASMLTGAQTYLSAIRAAIDVTLDGVSLVVWSRAGAGGSSVVNQLQIGNIFDTQRRRRDTLVENYLSVAFP